jgi:thioredoxin-related protein
MLQKKRWPWLVIIGILLAAPGSVTSNSGDTIDWLSYEKAQQLRQDRKYLVYFNASWCGFCRKMESTTFKDPEIVTFINRNFTPVLVNIDQEKQIAAQYGVRGVPDLRFISSKGEPIARWPGFIKSEQLLPLLKYIHSDSYLTQEYSQFLKDHS